MSAKFVFSEQEGFWKPRPFVETKTEPFVYRLANNLSFFF